MTGSDAGVRPAVCQRQPCGPELEGLRAATRGRGQRAQKGVYSEPEGKGGSGALAAAGTATPMEESARARSGLAHLPEATLIP